MADLNTGTHNIHYEVIDLTAPWIEAPETIFFHHGVGANWRCWLGWAAALTDRYRLVALTCRAMANPSLVMLKSPLRP